MICGLMILYEIIKRVLNWIWNIYDKLYDFYMCYIWDLFVMIVVFV